MNEFNERFAASNRSCSAFGAGFPGVPDSHESKPPSAAVTAVAEPSTITAAASATTSRCVRCFRARWTTSPQSGQRSGSGV